MKNGRCKQRPFFLYKLMNKDKVFELLKTIQYPGFSRDIVSFGMVRDIIIDDDSVSIILQIKTQQEGKKQDIVKKINDTLEESSAFTKINITIEEGTDQQPQSSAPQSSSS